MYEITFTEAFKDGLSHLPREICPIVDRQLRLLEADPFAKNPNATKMKNAPCSFRARIGIHVRMLYRVHSKQKRVVVLAIGTRDHIYESHDRALKPLSPQEADAIRAEISGAHNRATGERSKAGVGAIQAEPVPTPELPVTVEELHWITEDELFLLHIPPQNWAAIIGAGSVDGMKGLAIDAYTTSLIEDYWTHPSATQVEKLYGLSFGQGSESIAQQPLSHFLIALDPEQTEALQKIKMDGPYLLKGSAGTGKSLVGLYHMRDLIQSRSGQTLFDGTPASFGVITYTNTLVDANQRLLTSIAPQEAHTHIHCSTLDKIAFDLAWKELGHRPQALNTEGIAKWIMNYVQPNLHLDTVQVLQRMGYDFFADEIEQVIQANGISSLADYLEHKRRGRKRGLNDGERRAVWKVFEGFKDACSQRDTQTFEEWRILALRYLANHPEYPRFTALFVDEAQDLTKVARQLCLELVKDPRHLLLAADTGQSIYTVPPSWVQSDPRFNFNRRKPIKLEKSYRATREISLAIAPLRLELEDGEDVSGSARPVFTGPKPQWIQRPLAQHPDIVCDLVEGHVYHPTHPVHPGQIAIIVRENHHAHRYQEALERRGVRSVVVAKGSPLQINSAHVHIITAHSSKGMGFPVVVVPEVEASTYPWQFLTSKAKDQQQREQIEEGEQRLLYVALSRASHQLHMVVDSAQPSPFVSKLDRQAHWS